MYFHDYKIKCLSNNLIFKNILVYTFVFNSPGEGVAWGTLCLQKRLPRYWRLTSEHHVWDREDYSVILLLCAALHPLQSTGKRKQNRAPEMINRLLPLNSLLMWMEPRKQVCFFSSYQNLPMNGARTGTGEITQKAVTVFSPGGDFSQADTKNIKFLS